MRKKHPFAEIARAYVPKVFMYGAYMLARGNPTDVKAHMLDALGCYVAEQCNYSTDIFLAFRAAVRKWPWGGGRKLRLATIQAWLDEWEDADGEDVKCIALGHDLVVYCRGKTEVLTVFRAALIDANFHRHAAKVKVWMEEEGNK